MSTTQCPFSAKIDILNMHFFLTEFTIFSSIIKEPINTFYKLDGNDERKKTLLQIICDVLKNFVIFKKRVNIKGKNNLSLIITVTR